MSSDHHHDHDDQIHPAPTTFLTKYVFSIDHKVIGLQFLFTALAFVIVGGALALGVRYQLAWPNQNVPFHAVTPGNEATAPHKIKMTDLATEQNLARWIAGGEVVFNKDVVVYNDQPVPATELAKHVQAAEGLKDEALANRVAELAQTLERYPQGTRASLTGFTNGLAVYIPPGVEVIEEGDASARDRREYVKARIDPIHGMGDYNYKGKGIKVPGDSSTEFQQIRVHAPTKLTEETAPGESEGQKLTIVSARVYRPNPSGVSRNYENTTANILLPIRANDTTVTLAIADQPMPVKDAAELAAFHLTDDERKDYGGKLAAITAHNADIEEKRTKLREEAADLKTQAEQAGDAAAKGDLLAKADTKEAEATALFGELKKLEIMVPVKGTLLAGVPAAAVDYPIHVITGDAYLTLFTMHATIMVFFVLMPVLLGAFGNFLIPLMIGARDMAFPKLNMLSYWIAVPAGILMIASFWVQGGASGGGWTMYPTHSTSDTQGFGTTLWLISVGLAGFSTIVGTLNYLTTIVNMRAPGMGMFRMPLSIWSLFITSILALFATPVLTAAAIMLLFDRILGTMFFSPMIERMVEGAPTMVPAGGQPLLWQHLFWFFGHPEVYILILPPMGIASDILAIHARKPIFGYRPMVFAMAAISGLGFIVWGHHMFQSGMNPAMGTTFMAATIMIAVPSAIKTFNWLGTIWGGDIRFTPPMLWALGFVSMFVIGGLSGIFMAAAPVDIPLHDTYFIVAHIHYVLFGGTIMGVFAGVYQWFPKMFGRQLNQKWGTVHFVLTIIALNGTFFLMHVLGIGGHPRRYASIMEYESLQHLQGMNVLMTIFAMMLGMAQIPFFFNFFTSLPMKLSRAMVTVFILFLVLPAIIGLTFWGGFTEGVAGYLFGHNYVATEAVPNPLFMFAAWQNALGYLLFGGLITVALGLMLWQLPRAGKIAAFLTMAPVYALMLYLIAARISGGITAEDFSTPMTLSATIHNLMVSIGLGTLVVIVVIAAVLIAWKLGTMVRLSVILDKALWIGILPLFMLPMIIKKEAFMWIGRPNMHPESFVGILAWLAVFALPGLAYLLIAKPRSKFGYDPGRNPWNANSLEWTIDSPPPYYNFDEIPHVHRGPYEYNSPASEKDYLPQPEELPPGVVEPAGH